VARVAVEVEPFHLDRPFDYLVGDLDPAVGARVEVVFAGRRVKGVVLERVATSDVPPERLRPLRRQLGDHVWMTAEELDVARWAADRWGGTLADVLRHALPARTVDVERRAAAAGWYPRSPRPAAPPPPATGGWDRYAEAGTLLLDACRDGAGGHVWRPLADEDVAARVTELVRVALAGDRDVVVVVPDPVSPLADAVVAAVGDLAVDVRGDTSPRVTYKRWLAARCGQARVVVGGRGVAFWPVDRLGLMVVLDEANPAHKELRSPRHHTREVALERARRAGGVALLVGAVASAATWGLLRDGRITPVAAPRATERDAAPRVHVDDHPRGRLGSPALQALKAALAEGAHGLVLATRRGQGTALACRSCGAALRCPTCASTVAPDGDGLRCRGCGWHVARRPDCPVCGRGAWVPLAAGAQRLGEELRRSLPGATVAVLEGHAASVPAPPAVLVTTRGSVLDAPPGPVGAVVLPDLDASTRRPQLDAGEDALRLATTLASWVAATTGHRRGDDERGARVVVQTREPEHPVVQALVRWDPSGYWRAETDVRAELGFPPARQALKVDAPAAAAVPLGARLAELLAGVGDVLGPLADGDRATWLVKCDDRAAALAALAEARAAWSKDDRDVRIDVDPVGML
jgi:primosomal protein N' (replication factor Y)